MGFETWTDSILTWLGAAGVFSYIVYVHQQRTRSNLEGKILLLLYTLGALFLVRGFSWLSDRPVLAVLTFVPATFLPLVMTLFVEAMMRRHAGLALKVFAAAGAVVFVPWNVLDFGDRSVFFIGFRTYALLTFGWLGLMLVTRRRKDHAPIENQLIDGFTAVLAIGFFLIMTDVQLRPEWLPFRLGSIGGLIFVYTCVRLTNLAESPMAIVHEVALVGLMALAATATLMLLMSDAPRDFYIAAFVVLLSFILLYTILGRLRVLRTRYRRASFYQWLLKAPTGSLEEFIESLRSLPFADDHIVLRGNTLQGYDPEIMARAFAGDHPVWTIAALQNRLVTGEPDPGPSEQLIELLGENQMTHVTLLGGAPPAFLLLNAPQFAGSLDPAHELALIHKYSIILGPEDAESTPMTRSAPEAVHTQPGFHA